MSELRTSLNERRKTKMCKGTQGKGCQFPQRLKGKPEECTPEQIKECHGEVKEHPCIEKNYAHREHGVDYSNSNK